MSIPKKAKQATCGAKGCRNKYWPANSFHVACCPMCAIRITKQKKQAKEKVKRVADKQRLLELKPASYWVKKAQKATNAYIRERDKDEPCISCGRYHQGKWNAGHLMSCGARPELRFHPSNIHKQCEPCNSHLSGNIVNYRPRLIEKVGLEMVEHLENFNGVQRLTIDDVQEIEAHYKGLLKELKK